MSNNFFEWIERYLSSNKADENSNIESEQGAQKRVNEHQESGVHTEPQPPQPHDDSVHLTDYSEDGHDHSGEKIAPATLETDSANVTGTTTTGALEADQTITNQNWENVTTDRTVDTWYGPTSRDKKFLVAFTATQDGSSANAIVRINETQGGAYRSNDLFDLDNGDSLTLGEFTVPAGSYYQISYNVTTGTVNLDRWSEL